MSLQSAVPVPVPVLAAWWSYRGLPSGLVAWVGFGIARGRQGGAREEAAGERS